MSVSFSPRFARAMAGTRAALSGWVVTEFKWPTQEDHELVRMKEAETPTGDEVQDFLEEAPAYVRLAENKEYLVSHGAEVQKGFLKF